jgi:hypothetical protein
MKLVRAEFASFGRAAGAGHPSSADRPMQQEVIVDNACSRVTTVCIPLGARNQ